MKSLKRLRRGFTLVEVALFLAITGVLFIGIALGVQGSLFQQRYNDSVQSFAEFLRSVYSGTMNVQGKIPGGRSGMAIYGKLVTFGEEYGFDGNKVSEQKVFVYDVVGKVGDIGTGKTLDALKSLDANVIVPNGESWELAGMAEEYTPRWLASIQKTQCNREWGECDFVGAVLVVRHPSSGVVYTFVMQGDTIQVNYLLKEKKADADLLKKYLEPNIFTNTEPVDFCVNPEGDLEYHNRRDIRIAAGARNASGVEVIDSDSVDNKCEQ